MYDFLLSAALVIQLSFRSFVRGEHKLWKFLQRLRGSSAFNLQTFLIFCLTIAIHLLYSIAHPFVG
jgi:hypothetical protein